ncbi:hypothetical protein GYA93_10750 [Gordonia desulfuricans]|uniref:Tat pathway signal sequence domain protein n=1 Tax=Gordonia desulfuricans TaxID=89051 RepID=A0A7K3LPG2_9ACTN|nr:hypothetical protein [Gordonia desulfuricans]NDK90056.1 hypothetical protein [Gordonia desulfuricans]
MLTTRRLVTGATVAAAAAAIAVPTAGTAHAAPATVYQIPASALAVSGLVVPGPYFASVTAQTTGKAGELRVSAPASPSICSSSAAGALVRIGYVGLTTGRSGGVTVKPCPYFLDPAPTSAVIHPGGGQALLSIQVTGSAAYPNAGQPSLPGVATVGVP